MEYLFLLFHVAEKVIDADERKNKMRCQTAIDTTNINANKEKYIAGIIVTGVVTVTGLITNAVSKRVYERMEDENE